MQNTHVQAILHTGEKLHDEDVSKGSEIQFKFSLLVF